MILFRKLFLSVIFSALFCLVFSPSPSRAQTTQLTGQPTPQIISPLANASLGGIVVINTIITPTVVQKMEIYANSTFLGLAQPLDSMNWFLNWDTANVTNGQYGLMARATIISTIGYPIDTFSQTVPVTVKNAASVAPTPQTSKATGTTSEDQSQTGSSSTTSPSTTVTSANISSEQQLSSQAKDWKVVASISFPKTTENQLLKIAYKLDTHKKEYLVFTGIATPKSQVTLKIQSQPIVITTRADSSGNWEYIFEKPLAPGEHQVTVEIIKPTGEKVSSGPFDFLIARAQASADNPTGASLQLVDPTKKMYLYYYLIAGGAVTIALAVLIIILWRRKKKGVNV
jgi:hypothetical protein